jgi:hypothetical protein
MREINTWWKAQTGERFWLGVTSHDGEAEVLAVPWREGRSPRSLLLSHVQAGDVVFHFDPARQRIDGWSVPNERAHRHHLPWASLSHGAEAADPAHPETEPSLALDLDGPVPLERPVTLDEIANVQWGLFPALQELEDLVGDPLYYPFAMGNADDTHIVPGHVFKLPGLFIRCFPAMVHAIENVPWARESVALAS